MPTNPQLLKIKRYEHDFKMVLEQYRIDYKTDKEHVLATMKLDFFPVFLVNQHFRGHKPELLALPDKLRQIGLAVSNELDFYDDLKVPKPPRKRGQAGAEDGTLSEEDNDFSHNGLESVLGKRPKDSALEAAEREVGNITELAMKVNEATG